MDFLTQNERFVSASAQHMPGQVRPKFIDSLMCPPKRPSHTGEEERDVLSSPGCSTLHRCNHFLCSPGILLSSLSPQVVPSEAA